MSAPDVKQAVREAVERVLLRQCVSTTRAGDWFICVKDAADMILADREAREGPLEMALDYLAHLGGTTSEGNCFAREALAAYRALDAPPPPPPLWRVDHHENGHHYFWRGGRQLGALWDRKDWAVADSIVEAMNASEAAALKRQGGA